MASGSAGVRGLARLAQAHGVSTSYVDLSRTRRTAKPDALLAVLKAVGAPVEAMGDVSSALDAREAALWERAIDPVVVAWDGKPPAIELRWPAAVRDAGAECRLELEDGAVRAWREAPAARASRRGPEGERAQRLRLPGRLPHGYHRLHVQVGGREASALIISAPVRAWAPQENRREWGVFMPLYALRTADDWGTGDFGDLGELAAWVAQLGGAVVATLPLLAAFVDQPLDPSPYSPVSRLFWNECYIDAARAAAEDGTRRVSLGALEERLRTLRALPEVDYRGVARVRRQVLAPLARSFFEAGGDRSREFEAFRRENARVYEYARFRAACEAHASGWQGWPSADAAARFPADDDAVRYHVFAQWLANRQLREVSASVKSGGGRFYLDLPLGVRPDGFDVWQHRSQFALDLTTGAPPDPFFSKGQSWGFPPPAPDAMREGGYGYFRECVRSHMRYAGVLRLDHVMGLHRLFCIPAGGEAADGVYVRYNAEELYAILTLESHRHETLVVGEDLGTVPAEVRRGMARHGLQRMSVLQYEVDPGQQPPVRKPPRTQVASVNTHDMPTFASFWRALDVDDRVDLGLLDEQGAEGARRARAEARAAILQMLRKEGLLAGEEPTAEEVHRACLRYYGASRARVVLCTLEDLWAETRPQNTPGTFAERPNWRRRARYALEEMQEMKEVVGPLRALDASRKSKEGA